MSINSAADYVRATRAALGMSGFTRHELGGTVYWVGGQAEACPTFVLVHGVNDQAGTWAAIAAQLARTHHVILPDLPGHGESEPKEGPIPLSLMVDRLAAVMECVGHGGGLKSRVAQTLLSVRAAQDEPMHTGLQPPEGAQTGVSVPHSETVSHAATLVGNSLGGWISILYTLKHPDKVQRLILEAAGGLARPFATPTTATTPDAARTLLRAVHGPNFEPPAWAIDAVIARATDAPMLRVTEIMTNFVDARLKEINVPTTLVWGADDGVLPIAYAEALQVGIAGAKLHVIDGAAHIPHLQQPERFLACLTAT